MNRPSTIYEVAARAGVSPATVSRVFNGLSVSGDKARRVRQAADELSFSPNRAARTLRRRYSEIIALVIPDIENPFFTALARGAEDVAQAAAYSIVLCNTDGDPEKEARYLGIAASENMAGVIIAPAGFDSDLAPLTARGRPVVAVDRSPRGYEIDTVTVDNQAGGAAATDVLIAAGFGRIACITGPRDVETAALRAAGWRQSLKQSNKSVPDEYLVHANYRIDGGREAMERLLALSQPPEAVFVANNLMSVGVLQALGSRGIDSAFGVSVFGDLPYWSLAANGVARGLTIVHLPARRLGSTAATLLLKRIHGDRQPARTVVLENKLDPELEGENR